MSYRAVPIGRARLAGIGGENAATPQVLGPRHGRHRYRWHIIGLVLRGRPVGV